jgi:hypothetical protein
MRFEIRGRSRERALGRRGVPGGRAAASGMARGDTSQLDALRVKWLKVSPAKAGVVVLLACKRVSM